MDVPHFSFAKSGNFIRGPYAAREYEACGAKQYRSLLFCLKGKGSLTVSGAARLCPDAAGVSPALSLLEHD